jgi:hypothetical protein
MADFPCLPAADLHAESAFMGISSTIPEPPDLFQRSTFQACEDLVGIANRTEPRRF